MHVVLCTCSPEQAPDLARSLVEDRLVACVNLLPGIRSLYRWEGEIQDDAEVLMILKTSPETLPRLLEELPRRHPYDVPEVLALEVDQGFEPYVAWVREQTRNA